MKGYLFLSDVFLAVVLLALVSGFLVHLSWKTTDTISRNIVLARLQTVSNHAVDVLLFSSSKKLRCWYGDNIPVPLCTWDNGADKNMFWIEEVNCAIVGSGPTGTVAAMMGCSTSPPSSYSVEYNVPFQICWSTTGNPKTCTWYSMKLVVWR